LTTGYPSCSSSDRPARWRRVLSADAGMAWRPDAPGISPRSAGRPVVASSGAQPGQPQGGIRRRVRYGPLPRPFGGEENVPSLKGAVESARPGAFRRMPDREMSGQAPEHSRARVTGMTGAGAGTTCAIGARANWITRSCYSGCRNRSRGARTFRACLSFGKSDRLMRLVKTVRRLRRLPSHPGKAARSDGQVGSPRRGRTVVTGIKHFASPKGGPGFLNGTFEGGRRVSRPTACFEHKRHSPFEAAVRSTPSRRPHR